MNKNKTESQSGKVWAGLFIICIGSVLLLRNVGLVLPSWLFSWSMLLVLLGVFIGLKHRFRHSAWIIMILIGSYFTLEKALDQDFDFQRVALPVVLLTIGAILIFKPKGSFKQGSFRKSRRDQVFNQPFDDQPEFQQTSEPATFKTEAKASNSHDYFESVNVFGGSHQSVYSKNFKGGEIVAVFGGCELNLTQADFQGTIEIDVTAVFGGCKIIVPGGWHVRSEVTAIFGGLDDKRGTLPVGEEPKKMLVLKGVAMFGGVDIRNF